MRYLNTLFQAHGLALFCKLLTGFWGGSRLPSLDIVQSLVSLIDNPPIVLAFVKEHQTGKASYFAYCVENGETRPARTSNNAHARGITGLDIGADAGCVQAARSCAHFGGSTFVEK